MIIVYYAGFATCRDCSTPEDYPEEWLSYSQNHECNASIWLVPGTAEAMA